MLLLYLVAALLSLQKKLFYHPKPIFMMQEGNALNWFEIPVTDMKRAKKFYETIFEFDDMYLMPMGGFEMAGFPTPQSKVGGALVKGEGYTPSTQGSLVYLNANPDLMPILGRIEAAGGKVLMPKTQITPEIGYFALFQDSEGNKVALHSGK
jgi:predicted enzyme related to lactoylglutathione lyase